MKKFFLFVLLAITTTVFSQTLQRGPYLQSLTNTSVKVMWRTSDSTHGVVRYGDSPTTLNNIVTETKLSKDHIVKISGLIANTKYYYSVGQDVSVLAGGDERHHFLTALTPGDSTTGFKFWVTGDFGSGNTGQKKVRDWFRKYLENNKVTGWLWLGDNAYTNGTDEEYSQKVFSNDYGYDSIFRFLPFYPIPGNHDYNSVNNLEDPSIHKGPYFDIVEVFKNAEMGGVPSNTEVYYSYDIGNTHFLALNSEVWKYLFSWDLGNPYRTWLEQDLKSTNKKFKVAYWHQPPYSMGSHNSDNFWEVNMASMRDKVIPVLERYGVDLILCGHSHVYERSYLINKHYGPSYSFKRNTMIVDSSSGNPDSNRTYIKYTYGENKNKGTVYGVVGNSSKSDADNGLMHKKKKKKYSGDDAIGSMILEVEGNELTGTFYKDNGEVFDKFRIVKKDSTSVISGVKNNTNVENLLVYPNPFRGSLMVEFNAKDIQQTSITIQNITGQLIVETIWQGRSNIGKNKIELNNLQNLPDGEYILSIKQNNEIVSEKVVKL